MQIKNLTHVSFEAIVDCFHESFADYFIDINLPASFWKKRWTSDQVDFNLSFGMYDKGKLVGFVLNGIGIHNGKKTALNAGTGVIPAYRGQRIVKQLYAHILPIFVENKIKICILEVIQENIKAIRAYQSVGYKIIKNYKCFAGDIVTNPINNTSCLFHKVKTSNWEKYAPLNAYGHSWGNSKTSIEIAAEYEYWEMTDNTELIGYFIVHPTSGTIAQLEIKNQNWSKYGAALFNKMATIQTKVRINNLDEKDAAKIKCLQTTGLKSTIDQYEMEWKIKV